MVRIAGFHPADPGSIPGMGIFYSFIILQWYIKVNLKYYNIDNCRLSNASVPKSGQRGGT